MSVGAFQLHDANDAPVNLRSHFTLNLETAVGRSGVCEFLGAGQGATTRNGRSIPRSCNADMHPKNRAIHVVAVTPKW